MAETSERFECTVCKCSFTFQYLLTRHLQSQKHLNRVNNPDSMHICVCGKKYMHKKSLEYHCKTCIQANEQEQSANVSAQPQDAVTDRLDEMQQKIDDYEKERIEMRAQIALLMDKHAGNITNNNQNIETQNIENQQNIHIHINAFGKENTDYLDTAALTACIDRVYKCVPAIVERMHFDPDHPENHNIKITNKKLPYASVMGDNRKWTMIDRKDAIETMVNNGYNFLDEKYPETKHALSAKRREHFEGFQTRFLNEDKDLMKKVKSDVELIVLNASMNGTG